ncbi:MAG: hypothetical protein ACKVZJ_05135 [Phycisphaerales bacterium]
MRSSITVVAVLALAGVSSAIPFTGTFSENFNSMGTSGTTPPAGFSMKTGPSGTNNSTWTTSIPGSGVAALINTASPLTATGTYPSATNNNGFNAPAYNGVTPVASDRALATSPTTTSGAAIELVLTNNTGGSLASINLSYDTERYRVASTANELPGYWLFVSLNGTTWTEVVNFRPTITTVPNTLGVSSFTGTLTFPAAVAAGSDFRLRWVDDNADQTSPDAIIGLDNVVITPTPGAAALLGLSAVASIRRRRN